MKYNSNIIKNNIIEIVTSMGYEIRMSESIVNLFNYMDEKLLFGGCHALSAVLYVVLSELGFNPVLYIGECEKEGIKPFDHSWITIDDKIIDLAIYMPLTQIYNSISGPIILNIDAISKCKVNTSYGINTGLPLSDSTLFAINTPFVEYMNEFPFEIDGLWTVAKKISPSISLSIDELVEKYKNTQRKLVR